MSCFPCCASQERINKKSLKKSIKEYHEAKTLSSFANISFKTGKLISQFQFFLLIWLISFIKFDFIHRFHNLFFSFWKFEFFIYIVDSGKRRFIADEIAKLGKGNVTSKVFSYRDLCSATQNFHPPNMIGEGGFGRVYKGNIKSTNQVLRQPNSLFNTLLIEKA